MPCNLPEPWQQASRTPFTGGLTNRHWLLSSIEGRALLRQNSAALELGINRQAEHQLWQAASEAGISPALIWQEGDWALSRFIDAPTGAANTPARLIALLKAVNWLQGLEGAKLPLLPLRERALALGATDGPWLAYRLVEASPLPEVPAHVDLNPENCLWQGERLWLIDWEYASLADPYYDLAAIVVSHELAPQRLCSAWRSLTGKVLVPERLLAMCAIYAHLCECWCRHPQAGYLAYAAHYRKAWQHCLVALAGVD
ncbi:MAG: choline/ethanolamine kinase family protein [Pseudomonadota bacterium]|uniref:choline/ethanolamine kinase family protein n=1 Tax=Gallaecimonas pentaromativorans TaxID=584787 RepID=UPI00067F3530|nr:choline/ethanolamine kinase family protein [Gallaecimonas pentaromativorans]MED5525600.1 choline/ethanolamine kinase family protein [Pseudomonadota bacterium]